MICIVFVLGFLVGWLVAESLRAVSYNLNPF